MYTDPLDDRPLMCHGQKSNNINFDQVRPFVFVPLYPFQEDSKFIFGEIEIWMSLKSLRDVDPSNDEGELLQFKFSTFFRI